MTKKEKFEVISAVFATIDREDKDEILEFCKSEVEALDRRTQKAKETSAKKRAEGDSLKDALESVLGEEPMTIADILDAMADDSLTPAKVTSRMAQLVRAEKVKKEIVKVEGRKLVGYTKA